MEKSIPINKEERERIFCGFGKQFSDTGLSVTLCLSDIPLEHIHKNDETGKEYIDLTLWKIKNPKDARKKTHSLQIDLYNPKNQK